ncbi:MAG TPA: alpha/beta hydrolase [Caulobacteraceae bacterium]
MAQPMTYAQFQALKQPKAELRIPYGPGPDQFGELWLPKGQGPHPVVVMIHGGCWQASVARLDIMNLIADALRRRGTAVWNIEYRGVDQPGGGYPGTFEDVAAAIDRLREIAPRHRLKLDKVVAVGHSAGGHLALWAAGRGRLPEASPLRTARPLPIAAAVSLAGLADLGSLLEPGVHGCEVEAIRKLAAPAAAGGEGSFAETSPAELLPLGSRQISIHAAQDRIAPVAVGEAYTRKARAAGDPASLTVLTGAGHFELIAPGTPAWTYAAARIAEELR